MSLEMFAFPTSALDTLARAVIIAVNPDGTVVVASEIDSTQQLVCDRLVTGLEPVPFEMGDVVLFHAPSGGERGVVLGRIHPPRAVPTGEPALTRADAPDALVLEAKHELTLRVGDGSITIRADGKILIKGTDLVSHAKRMNRIKGGAVSIN